MKTLTIKCFGHVEIEGEGELPSHIKLVTNGDVTSWGQPSLVGADITCYADIVPQNIQVTGEMVLNGKVQTIK